MKFSPEMGENVAMTLDKLPAPDRQDHVFDDAMSQRRHMGDRRPSIIARIAFHSAS